MIYNILFGGVLVAMGYRRLFSNVHGRCMVCSDLVPGRAVHGLVANHSNQQTSPDQTAKEDGLGRPV